MYIYSIQSVWVGKSKDLLDRVVLHFLFIFKMQWAIPHSLAQRGSHIQLRVWSTAYLMVDQTLRCTCECGCVRLSPTRGRIMCCSLHKVTGTFGQFVKYVVGIESEAVSQPTTVPARNAFDVLLANQASQSR